MHKKSIFLTLFSVVIIAAFMTGCVGMAAKPTAENFAAPVVTLESMTVTNYTGYYYFSKGVKPTKGKPDNIGAPMVLLFTFNVENTNKFPVLMDELGFTIAFEDFDLNTVKSVAAQWIPPGETNQIAVPAYFDTRQSLLSLLVTGGFQLKAKGTNVWKQLEAWWTGIPNYEVPVHVKGGSAVFSAGGMSKVATFNATFP